MLYLATGDGGTVVVLPTLLHAHALPLSSTPSTLRMTPMSRSSSRTATSSVPSPARTLSSSARSKSTTSRSLSSRTAWAYWSRDVPVDRSDSGDDDAL